jgi:hypothetical protein
VGVVVSQWTRAEEGGGRLGGRGVTLRKLGRVQRAATSKAVGVGRDEVQEGVHLELAGGRPRHQDFVVDMDAERRREGERIHLR